MHEVIEAAKRLSECCNHDGTIDCEHCQYAETAEDGLGFVIVCSGDYKIFEGERN